MFKRIKNLIASLSISGMLLMPIMAFNLVPQVASAAGTSSSTPTSSLCGGVNLTLADGTCDNSTGSLNNVLKWVLRIFQYIVGIAAVIMILVGGMKYTLSGGASDRVSSAKDTILFAVVGLVVVLIAQLIISFVLTNVGGAVSNGAGH